MTDKKSRQPNFTEDEEEVLLTLIEKNFLIIENKKCDAISNEEKYRTWVNIAKEFVTICGVDRSEKNLKLKYDNMKKKAKKEFSESADGCSWTKTISATSRKIVALMTCRDSTGTVDCGSELVKIESNIEDNFATFSDINKPDIDNDDFGEGTSWSTWNPPNSGKPAEDLPPTAPPPIPEFPVPQMTWSKNRHDLVMEALENKIDMLNAQREFFINKEKRADEKHAWEKEQHDVKMEILRLEIEIKKKQLLKETCSDSNFKK